LNGERGEALAGFYRLISQLEDRMGGPTTLASCDRETLFPARGVYFFFERGETRTGSGTGGRIVRVGTHALKLGAVSTLRGRLAQHRGGRSGGGNHRGSIFRLLVGDSLLRRSARKLPSWGLGGTLREAAGRLGEDVEEVRLAESPLEQEVSEYIGAMPLVWLDVSDEASPNSQRSFIERNSIALLSNAVSEIDAASPDWLGRHSSRLGVRNSGLWNNNHVLETCAPGFLSLLSSRLN